MSLTDKIKGKRSRGRPTQKYMDELVRATHGMIIANQLLQLTRRKEWRSMIADVPRDMAP